MRACSPDGFMAVHVKSRMRHNGSFHRHSVWFASFIIYNYCLGFA